MFVVEDNTEFLGAMVEILLHRFEELIIEAIAGTSNAEAGRRMLQTLISASIGMKRQVGERWATAIAWWWLSHSSYVDEDNDELRRQG